ncbi:hypothetical protein HLK59_44715 [Streptomyces sp. S3(2020)]|uniref:hypothetical protein n=1 Tax=Streptomyces sp. S3(2020) TaxID=2732044 RepID=UPI001489D1A8|nr:hypothetical protein [Streptomyces sp. S3(2020)]NNN37320.1 hypothetical protein [Streptomyces sp. S3(2020)]
MKRAALALPLLSVLTLTTLTACGGADDGGSDAKTTTEPKATASQAKPAVDPVRELTKLFVTKAELPDYTVDEPAKGDAMAETQEDMRVDKAACAPLAYATNYLPLGDPEASVVHVATDGTFAYHYITLATYAEGKAEAAMKGLAEAVSSCTAGYTATSDKASTPYTSVTKETPFSDAAADESIATASTVAYKGTQTMRTQTFRFGDTIVNYFSIDSNGFMKGRSSSAKVPTPLVKAQNTKLH